MVFDITKAPVAGKGDIGFTEGRHTLLFKKL